jgi:hypothetical protein
MNALMIHARFDHANSGRTHRIEELPKWIGTPDLT